MPAETAAPVMPPAERILSLPPEQAACIVLADIGGARWEQVERRTAWHEIGDWHLRSPIGTCWVALFQRGGVWAAQAYHGLPNPFTDPAAAWELETRERLHVRPQSDGWAMRGPDLTDRWVAHADRKHAAVLAVLHKYASDPRYSALIPPLLKKMEAQDGK